ncbi:MAG: hypothetical protein GY771_02775 [bacterium]|nr:hypothetical protein [bacterium]
MSSFGILRCYVPFAVCGYLIIALTGCCCGEMIDDPLFGDIDDFDPENEPWVEVDIELPDDAGKAVFMRRNAHPFFAEYNRKIRLELTGHEPVEIELEMNTGGKTLINVYYLPYGLTGVSENALLLLQDYYGDYPVDLAERRLLPGYWGIWERIEPPDTGYLGRLDGSEYPLKFVTATESPEEELEIMADKHE